MPTYGFHWDPTTAIAQIATQDTTDTGITLPEHHYYGPNGQRIGAVGLIGQFFSHDAHGHTRQTATTATVTRAAGYDPYGNPDTTDPATRTLLDDLLGTTGDPTEDATPTYGYRSETHLNGLIHLRNRDYTPGTGRFTTVDPLEGVPGEPTVANPYPYAANDPLNQIDPLGLSPVKDRDLRCQAGTVPTSVTPTRIGAYGGQQSQGCLAPGGSFGISARSLFEGAGFVPGIGDFFDSLLCGGSILSGNYGDAGYDCAAIVPILGSLGRGLKYTDEVVDVATSAAQGSRLTSQLAAQEIAGGHAFNKHVLTQGEFPGIRTRAQFAETIGNVIDDYDDIRYLSGGRTAYWRDGVVVIRDPSKIDGGTAFVPRDGYDYFLKTLR